MNNDNEYENNVIQQYAIRYDIKTVKRKDTSQNFKFSEIKELVDETKNSIYYLNIKKK